MTPLLFPPRRKPSRWRRAWSVWLDLPIPVRMGAVLIALVLAGLLSGCTNFQEIRPYGAIDLKDENTRLAEPHWIDWGTLWLGIKASFN